MPQRSSMTGFPLSLHPISPAAHSSAASYPLSTLLILLTLFHLKAKLFMFYGGENVMDLYFLTYIA